MAAVRADGHYSVLESLAPKCRRAVLDQCQRRSLRRGQPIWSQGDKAQFIALLAAGKAMSSYQNRNGRVATIGLWCAGDLLGARDLGSPANRQMTVRCLEDCVVYTLNYDRFTELVRRFPELALTIIRTLSLRLRSALDLALAFSTQPASERICVVLLALSERFGVSSESGVLIDLELTNQGLGSITGVSRQFVSGTLGNLKKRGVVRIRNRRLVITDLEALEALADLS